MVCTACLAIDDGAQDISEIDAASNRGIDDARMLREEIRYAPVALKYRVYIIDEVHMLTTEAFNALLKTLEEPPAHVVFILATTENHKVPLTILSRCQRFEFKRILTSDSVAYLTQVARKEGAKLVESAAELISRLSDGGMRDALSLLETCISVAGGAEITPELVKNSAGVAGSEHVFGISEAILNKDYPAALKIISDLHNSSKDMGRLLQELIRHYRNLMLLKLMPDNPDTAEMIVIVSEESAAYQKLTQGYSLQQILKNLEVIEEYAEKIPRRADKRLAAEMCVVQMTVDSGQWIVDSGQLNKPVMSPQTPQPQVQPQPIAPPKPQSLPPMNSTQETAPWASALATVSRLEAETPAELPPPVAELQPVEKIYSFINLLKQKGIEVKER